MNIDKIFHMDHYGVYVWTAYFITLFIFAINIWNGLREKRRIKKMIRGRTRA